MGKRAAAASGAQTGQEGWSIEILLIKSRLGALHCIATHLAIVSSIRARSNSLCAVAMCRLNQQPTLCAVAAYSIFHIAFRVFLVQMHHHRFVSYLIVYIFPRVSYSFLSRNR